MKKDLIDEPAAEAPWSAEAMLATVQRVGKIGAWEARAGSLRPSWTDEVFEIFGLDPAKGVPNWSEHRKLVHPDDWERAALAVGAARSEGTPYSVDFRILRSDGSVVWVHAVGRAEKDADGTVTRTFGTVQDITERKQVEEALAASEERYHTVADHTHDWEYWIAPDGRMVYSSPSCERVSGYRAEEFLSDPELIRGIVHPEDRARFDDHFFLVYPGVPERHVIDFRIVAKSGEVRWISHACQLVFGSDGRYLGRRGSNRDITDRKQAEQELRRTVELLSLTQRAAKAGCWFWQISTGEFVWTPELCELFGLPLSAKGSFETWRSVVHPDDVDAAHARILAAVKARQPLHNEYRIVHPDGRVAWIVSDGSTRYDEAGNPTEMAGICIDVTSVRRAEHERFESAVRYQELANRINNGVAIYRAVDNGDDFIFVDINPSGERLSRVVKEEIRGRSLIELFPSVKAMGLFDVFQRVWRTGKAEYLPTVLYQDSRIQQWVANSVFKLPSGEIATVYEDVTQRKHAEQQIQVFSQRLLSVREEERKRLATSLHHDLGSLAVGVMARLDALADELEAEHIELARKTAKACREQLQAALAELKKTAVELRPADLELLGLTSALRQHFARISQDTGLRIRFTDATGGRAIDDQSAIVLFRIGQEALNNVAQHARARTVTIRLAMLKAGVRLTIRDDGRGFDRDRVKDLPEPSLGLLSMREMALSMGGAAEVSSRPGHGTRVTVTLPYAERDR